MALSPEKGKELVPKGNDKPKKPKFPFSYTSPQCKICKLPPQFRRQLELMISAGFTQAEVLRHWNELLAEEYGPEYLNNQNMSNHVQRHLSARETAMRRVIEEKAVSAAVDDQERIILTKEAALDAVIVTGVQNIARGVTYVEPRELVNAIALKANLEAETGNVAVDELWRQFLAFQDAVKMIVSPEDREAIAAQFEKNLHTTAPKEIAATTTVTHIEAIEVTEEIPIEPTDTKGDTK